MSTAARFRSVSVHDNLNVLGHGREVIAQEAAALTLLAESLDESFSAAVSELLAVKGRIVVTGIGKSGHIARKIAATFSSVACPALFIHPAEAAHGDMGALMPGDALLALSNSGSTRELNPILARARQIGVPTIGITSRATSPLAGWSTIALIMPDAKEACPNNLAPSTSTAMMMALGDAIAMAMMRVRGMSRDGFEALHPGGVIGARLARVHTVMHGPAELPLVHVGASMREVILTITRQSFGIAGVVDDDGRLAGVVTDGDLRRHIDHLFESTAADVMTVRPVTIDRRAFVEDALEQLNDYKITALFVTADDDPRRPLGIVHIHDFLRLGFV